MTARATERLAFPVIPQVADKAACSSVWDKTDNEPPKLYSPNTDTDEPGHKKLRADRELPSFVMEKEPSEEPAPVFSSSIGKRLAMHSVNRRRLKTRASLLSNRPTSRKRSGGSDELDVCRGFDDDHKHKPDSTRHEELALARGQRLSHSSDQDVNGDESDIAASSPTSSKVHEAEETEDVEAANSCEESTPLLHLTVAS